MCKLSLLLCVFADTPCYTVINGNTSTPENSIESRNFDNGGYSPSSLCIWEITHDTLPGTISIKFDTLELEEQETCIHDYVKVIEGYNIWLVLFSASLSPVQHFRMILCPSV